MARLRKYLLPTFLSNISTKNRENIVPQLDEVKKYVNSSIIPTNEGRKCVDGRYLPTQGRGMIARPGGDCGYVMALDAVNLKKKLGYSPEECFNIIYKAIAKNGGKFGMHTDNIAHKGDIGCGHLAIAANKKNAKKYDVKSDDIKDIINYACSVSEISQGIEIVELNGTHQEKGVLIIESDDYTVLADNPELHQMYFIYDEKRDNDYLKKLVTDMNIPDVTFEDMKHESDLQLHATLNNLAGGLPIYSITFTGNKPLITSAGHVMYSQVPLPIMLKKHFPLHLLAQRFSRVFN